MTPSVRPQEQLLVELVPDLAAGRLLCNTAGRAQVAAAFAPRDAVSRVAGWCVDLDQRGPIRRAIGKLPGNLGLMCEADPPGEEFDLVACAFSQRRDGELTRQMLQPAHERLAIGGRLVTA